MTTVRCRIAPSPSGFLHIGTAKMALFNWLFARKTLGAFILRLEDTDAERTDETFVHAMCEGFKWLGIHWDEGPRFGDEPERGAFGPYRQSERRHLHQQEAHRLLVEGTAFKCFTSKEELEALREEARVKKQTFAFRSPWREATPEQIAEMGDAPCVIRFRVPEGFTEVHDLVQGVVRTNNKEIDDFVILRPNGDPIFHLAVVVDDGLMKITHVIRGDDHLTNAARHVMLFNALGYDLPKFAHLPMVLDEKGKKYSKRDRGANVLDWREDGYLPEALINYVALLGWTPAEENRELFTLPELIEAFTIDRWGKSAARFDRKKLDWLNGQHIRRLPVEELRDRLVPILQRSGFDVQSKSEAWLTRLAEICHEKLPTLNHIGELAGFFFHDIDHYEEKAVKKHFQVESAADALAAVLQTFEQAEAWTAEALGASVHRMAESKGESLGKYVHPTRLALTGKSVGPGLFELAELLGKETCLSRLKTAITHIKAKLWPVT
ncbi:MAG: glutamate--tRNA ligase [Candidatus Hydrogenedentes bacterium]|nr:glutamate--tRNA ligase [Candidatus Hydrogenedentota bacterium]